MNNHDICQMLLPEIKNRCVINQCSYIFQLHLTFLLDIMAYLEHCSLSFEQGECL